MKIRVTVQGTVLIDEREAERLRAMNRTMLNKSLGYRLESHITHGPIFDGNESAIKVTVQVVEDESVTMPDLVEVAA